MNGPILPGEDLTTVRNVPNRYQLTFGIKQGRGGYLLTEQMIINAKDEEQAYCVAGWHLKRGEALLSVEPIR